MEEKKVMIIFYYDKGEGEPQRICDFSTNHFSEWLKTFNYSKKHKVEFWPRTDDEEIPNEICEKIAGMCFYVDDVCFRFGSDHVIQCMDVYLR